MLLTLAASLSPLSGADWPQWRGPQRDGVAAAAELPPVLPEELIELWSADVGEGHASPVVAGETVYVRARVGEEEVVRALALADGAEIWRWSVTTPYTRNPAAFSHGRGPRSTPVVAGRSVCSLGVTGLLSCLDRETGQLRWERDFASRFDRTWPEFGTATSPAVVGDRLVAHVGGKKSGALIAFDLETGAEQWSWSGDAPAYASPVLATLDGVTQVVTQSREHVVAVDADSGALLWKMPFETAWQQNSVTPLVAGDRIVISGLDRGVTALDPRRDVRGNWVLTIAWRNDEVPMYMSSPVTRDGLLFGMTDKRKGQLFCLDLATGKLRWTSEGREGENAALILAGNRLFVQTTEAELLVGAAGADGWRPEARYTIAGSPTWAHPALVGGRVVVKDKTRVRVLGFRAGESSTR